MDGRTWIAGHGLQDTDTDMDRRTWIAGHGYRHGAQDMDCRTWTQQKEFKVAGT